MKKTKSGIQCKEHSSAYIAICVLQECQSLLCAGCKKEHPHKSGIMPLDGLNKFMKQKCARISTTLNTICNVLKEPYKGEVAGFGKVYLDQGLALSGIVNKFNNDSLAKDIKGTQINKSMLETLCNLRAKTDVFAKESAIEVSKRLVEYVPPPYLYWFGKQKDSGSNLVVYDVATQSLKWFPIYKKKDFSKTFIPVQLRDFFMILMTVSKECYMFIPSTGNKIMKASMINSNSSDAPITSVGNQFVYVLGDLPQKYDSILDIWRNVPKNVKKRNGASLCVLNGHFLYVFGGYNQWESVIERLDIASEEEGWKEVPFTDKCVQCRIHSVPIEIETGEVLIVGGYKSYLREFAHWIGEAEYWDTENAPIDDMHIIRPEKPGEAVAIKSGLWSKEKEPDFSAVKVGKNIHIGYILNQGIVAKKPFLYTYNLDTKTWTKQ